MEGEFADDTKGNFGIALMVAAEVDEQKPKEEQDETKRLCLEFPSGVRFVPTDVQLLEAYLLMKVQNKNLPCNAVKEINLYQYNPQQLTEIYRPRRHEPMYFFTPTERKYRNGSRPQRTANDGFWKASAALTPVFNKQGDIIGEKRSLVFHRGVQQNSMKTNWIMHEYLLPNSKKPQNPENPTMQLDEWVLCKIYQHKPERSNKEESNQLSGSTQYEKMKAKQVATPMQVVPLSCLPPPGQQRMLASSSIATEPGPSHVAKQVVPLSCVPPPAQQRIPGSSSIASQLGIGCSTSLGTERGPSHVAKQVVPLSCVPRPVQQRMLASSSIACQLGIGCSTGLGTEPGPSHVATQPPIKKMRGVPEFRGDSLALAVLSVTDCPNRLLSSCRVEGALAAAPVQTLDAEPSSGSTAPSSSSVPTCSPGDGRASPPVPVPSVALVPAPASVAMAPRPSGTRTEPRPNFVSLQPPSRMIRRAPECRGKSLERELPVFPVAGYPNQLLPSSRVEIAPTAVPVPALVARSSSVATALPSRPVPALPILVADPIPVPAPESVAMTPPPSAVPASSKPKEENSETSEESIFSGLLRISVPTRPYFANMVNWTPGARFFDNVQQL